MKKGAQFGLVFTVIAFSSMFLSTNGFAYDIADYFPLDQGFTWTYEDTSNGSTSEEIQTIDGTEEVGGVTRTKMVDDDGNYQHFAIHSQALALYKAGGRQEHYMIFDPPMMYFPADVEVGDSFGQHSDYTGYVNDVASSSGTVDTSGELLAVEDVSVPAGNFSGCLKFWYFVIQRESGVPGHMDSETIIWLAPDVGIVKSNGKVTEYDGPGQISDIFYQESVLLSYDASDENDGGGGGGGGGGCFIHSVLGWSVLGWLDH